VQQSHDMKKESINIILQPDAIYEEHYGDSNIDSLIKYLYPAGYQSMRPRSGPWKLSYLYSVYLHGYLYLSWDTAMNVDSNITMMELTVHITKQAVGGVDDSILTRS